MPQKVRSVSSIRLLSTCAALSLLSGCADRQDDSDKERELESATGGNVEIVRTDSSEIVTIEDGTNATTIASGEKLAAPANYPPDGFIPDDASIMSSASQNLSIVIVYSVPGSLSGVFDRNRKALRDRGWTEDDVIQAEAGAGYVSYQRGSATLSEEFQSDAEGRIQVTQVYDSGD